MGTRAAAEGADAVRLVAAAVAAVREAVAAVVAVVRVAVETVAVAPVGVGVARLAAVAVVAPVDVGVACLVAAAPAAAVAAMNRQMRHPLHARQHRTGARAGRLRQTTALWLGGGVRQAIDRRRVNLFSTVYDRGGCLCRVEARKGKLGRVGARHLVIGRRALNGALGLCAGGVIPCPRVVVLFPVPHLPGRRV